MVELEVRPSSDGSREHLPGRLGSSQAPPRMGWVLVD
jgi:hypothetical protein